MVTRFQRVGDMILFIPTLRELRKLFPNAKIDLLALESSGMEAIKGCPYIDQILIYWGGNGLIEKWLSRLKTRMVGYDIFITSCAETNLAREGFYIGAKYIIGFKEKVRFGVTRKEEEPYLLDIALDYDTKLHEVEQNLNIVKALGLSEVDSTLEYHISEEDALYVRNILQKKISSFPRFLICVHPGSNQPQKRWMPERFAEVSRKLINNFGACILFVGTAKEKDLVDGIIKMMGGKGINLAGILTLGQLAAFLKESDLLICNDSGPMHLGAAVGTPLVTVFGGGKYTYYWRPWTNSKKGITIQHEMPCAPCLKINCQDNICMKLISVNEVYEAAAHVLREETI